MDVFQIDSCVVDTRKLTVACNGQVRELSDRSINLINQLAGGDNQTVSRETLLENLWPGNKIT